MCTVNHPVFRTVAGRITRFSLSSESPHEYLIRVERKDSLFLSRSDRGASNGKDDKNDNNNEAPIMLMVKRTRQEEEGRNEVYRFAVAKKR